DIFRKQRKPIRLICLGSVWASPTQTPARSAVKIFLEPVELMHALMQDRDDTDIAVAQSAPIDEVVLVAEEGPFDAELCRDRLRGDAMGLNPFECFEHAGDVAVRLNLAPSVAR